MFCYLLLLFSVYNAWGRNYSGKGATRYGYFAYFALTGEACYLSAVVTDNLIPVVCPAVQPGKNVYRPSL